MEKQNYNTNEKQQKQWSDNPKFKLKTKVHGGNATEDAGPIIHDTDTKN
jgi:hypothetical protein